MRKFMIGLMLVAAASIAGCATFGNDKTLIARLVMNQLEATLDSVEIAMSEIKPDTDSETLRDIKIALKIAKPQILSWMDTIAQIQMASEQYDRAAKLAERANELMPQITAAVE